MVDKWDDSKDFTDPESEVKVGTEDNVKVFREAAVK